MCGLLLLCVWLLTSCEQAPSKPWTPSVSTVMWITLVVLVVLMAWAVLSVAKNEQWIEQLREDAEARRHGEEESGAVGQCASGSVGQTESPLPSLPPEELSRIYSAAVIELCSIREMVRKAQTSLSVEDYGDRLAGAETRLTQVIVCVARLMERVPVAGGAVGQSVSASVGQAESPSLSGQEVLS